MGIEGRGEESFLGVEDCEAFCLFFRKSDVVLFGCMENGDSYSERV